MSRGRKRGAGRQFSEGPLAALQALKPLDHARPAVVSAVFAKMRAGEFSRAERLVASSLLTPADWRRQHLDEGDVTVLPAGAARPTLCSHDHFSVRRTATIDGGGIRWTEDMVRERMTSAMDTLRRMRFPSDQMPSTKVAAGIEIARTQAELWELVLYGLDPPRLAVVAPTASQLDELDSTLPWLFAVQDWRHRLALALRSSYRAPAMSWRRVAAKLSEEIERRIGGKGIDHKTAGRWEERAVSEIVASLNMRRWISTTEVRCA